MALKATINDFLCKAARGANTLPGSFAASVKALLELRDIADRLASVIVKRQM
ncbi:MAG TPA: hypothetical protein VNO50_06605 [Pyrinomonadaceae bacterium]|nr:hypothetical protein [Pyrinomonadaceae bacterium]